MGLESNPIFAENFFFFEMNFLSLCSSFLTHPSHPLPPVASAANERLKELAVHLDIHAAGLSVTDRFSYTTSPVPRDKILFSWFLAWARAHSGGGDAGRPDFLGVASLRPCVQLERLERCMQASVLWLYLCSKFPAAYGWADEVAAERDALADCITGSLCGEGALGGAARQKGGGGWVRRGGGGGSSGR